MSISHKSNIKDLEDIPAERTGYSIQPRRDRAQVSVQDAYDKNILALCSGRGKWEKKYWLTRGRSKKNLWIYYVICMRGGLL